MRKSVRLNSSFKVLYISSRAVELVAQTYTIWAAPAPNAPSSRGMVAASLEAEVDHRQKAIMLITRIGTVTIKLALTFLSFNRKKDRDE